MRADKQATKNLRDVRAHWRQAMTLPPGINIRHVIEPEGLNRVYRGDCVDVMKSVPAGSIDMIFADPPYNLQLTHGLKRPDQTEVVGVKQDWDRFDSFDAYDLFTHEWLSEARRILKDDGTIWVIGSYHNIYRVGSMMQDEGFWILNDVVWRKTNPMPNFRGTRLANAHETLIWAAKQTTRSGYRFNYRTLKSLNDGLQMRSDWVMPICSGDERCRFADGTTAHPTQKPLALLRRILLTSTKEGDLILDPFFGTGTSGVVAKQLGRNFIGIEADEDYVTLARSRLEQTEPFHPDVRNNIPEFERALRIPFSWLIDHNLLNVGDHLYDQHKTHRATICADGSLRSGDITGSIHQLAAKLKGVEAVNGWVFWYLEDGRSIDELRRNLRDHLKNEKLTLS